MITDLSYTYIITHVDYEGKSMIVDYYYENKPPLSVGVRLPYENETIAGVIHMHAPTNYWLFQDMAVIPVNTGTSGSYTATVNIETLDSVKNDKKLQLSSWRYSRENSFILFLNKKISTSRESRVAINETLVNMQNNVITEINWKTFDGEFVTYNSTEFSNLSVAVFNHVQQCFNQEKYYLDIINGATSIEEVKAIEFGQIPVNNL